jgi:exosortase/archaeosortase family protein
MDRSATAAAPGAASAREGRGARDHTAAIALLLAAFAAASFAGVLLHAIDFPLGTQPDEISKVNAILSGDNNFAHPMLMLEVVRAANVLARLTDPQAVLELGRACGVLAGGLAVLASFLLAREMLPASTALAASIAIAVVPLVTVHARLLKEDIFALPFVLLALAALLAMLKTPTMSRGILLGTAAGLAASTKYVAGIVLPFALVVLMLSGENPRLRARFFRLADVIVLVAAAIFALIQLPVLAAPARFHTALMFNIQHAELGHDVRLPVTLTYGLFHLRESLAPGLGLPLLILGLLGLAAPFVAPPERRRPLIVITAFAALWYAVHELSPLKPFPGFARYMLPLAPLLIILGTCTIYEIARRGFGPAASYVAAALVLAAAAPLAIAANVLRVVALSALVVWYGSGVLDTFIHPLSGMMTFALALPVLFWLGGDLRSEPA